MSLLDDIEHELKIIVRHQQKVGKMFAALKAQEAVGSKVEVPPPAPVPEGRRKRAQDLLRKVGYVPKVK